MHMMQCTMCTPITSCSYMYVVCSYTESSTNPTNLIVTNVTHSPAVLSWDPPANENPDNIMYIVEVASSCQSGNILQSNLTRNTLSLMISVVKGFIALLYRQQLLQTM